ncbi:MAG TPA: ATP-binding protein, partial [Actinomycetota bacterium]|nr:ATP-binding protein [Actinomycetota bacterium]
MNDRIDSLRRAVEASPDDTTLRELLAEELVREGYVTEALNEFETLLARGQLSDASALWAGHVAVDAERADLAKGFLEAARTAGVVEGLAALQARVDGLVAQRAPMVRADDVPDGPASPWEKEVVSTTFDRVGGLDDVKKAINRAIVLPFSRPDLYERYGRKSGGGILLYGPPGCGKTLLARATAGEC